MKRCPICLTESVGGWPHRWHKEGHRKKGYTEQDLVKMVEAHSVQAIICDAVDLSRAPDNWQSKPKRTEYHREYYWRHVERRRKQRVVSKAMRRRLRTLIADLCRAVDLGRISARW